MKKMATVESSLAAVGQDGWALCYAPEAQRTAEVCMAAVRQNGGALEYVPAELRERVRAAVESGRTA